ncbi:DUF6497 family protein [Actibacterium lipolyticum]|uniref:Acetolactate synthase n=1 Tax=Actibacterium lipolyticum TaxID=1524263 RepID=A0A238JSC0_9RHOB|nr:DUF6497 family protein [Actibacterium lipolyticum]SMX32646.1 hypothetical protein COL8621_00868 [Actibacterium lipolyticum]
MTRPIATSAIIGLCAFPALADDAALAVPSGQPVTFLDAIWAEQGGTVRFRFVAPKIAKEAQSIDFAEAEQDMAFLCENYALPKVAGVNPAVSQVIISLSDRPVAFGQSAPDATQFFEAYQPVGDDCVWEGL